MQRKSPFPASVSPEAAKNMNSVKVGPFSCYCLMKPGEAAPLGEEDNFDYEEATPYIALADDTPDGAQGRSNGRDKLPACMQGPLASGPVPPLAPLGAGGWHLEEYFIEEMRKVRDEALHLFRSERQESEVSKFISEFLTPFTLFNYIRPHAPMHLKKALLRRAEREQLLSCQLGEGIELVGSMRILGFDGSGMSIVASEPCTMKESIGSYLDQVEYVSLTALDLNKPNPLCASGFIQFLDFGGGFNLTHFLDPRPCIALAQVWESLFRRRTKAIIVVEMPKTFQAPLNLFLQLSKHSTRNKVRFCANPQEALEELKKFGCDEQTLAQFRNCMSERRNPQIQPAWHPVVDLPFFRERLANLRLNQDTSFLTPAAHQRFREAIQEFRIQKWGSPMRPVLDESSADASSSSSASLAQIEQAIKSAAVNVTRSSSENENRTSAGKVVTTDVRRTDAAPNLRANVEKKKEAQIQEPTKLVLPQSPDFAEQQKPVAVEARKASATADREGCALGIARMLQRVVCCSNASEKLRAA